MSAAYRTYGGIALGFASLVLLVFFITNGMRAARAPEGKLSVVASFYPVYYLASEIGGEQANVFNVTPAGGEPHEYEPTSGDMARIERARLLVLNGAGLEAWGEDVKAHADPARTIVVEAGSGLATRRVAEDGEDIVDPHVWLSPALAQRMAEKIEAGYAQADPAHAAYYEQNAAGLKERLAGLDEEYRQGLADCGKKDIVTSHAAFGYLAAAYGLNQVAIAGLSPEEEPSPKALADIADFAKRKGVTHIFFESLISPKLSETIANEIGAGTLVLDPIEGITAEESASGEDYFTIMRRNLASLQTALQCAR